MPTIHSGADNLLANFADLQRNARTTVRIHAGNEVKINIEREQVSRFLALLNQVSRWVYLLAILS
jgi:sRNA-binding regulator protein Hfq